MCVVIKFCVFREAGQEAVVDMGGEVMGVEEAIFVHFIFASWWKSLSGRFWAWREKIVPMANAVSDFFKCRV